MQSRRESLIESIVSNVIGFVVAFGFQLYIFPLFDIHVSLGNNLLINFYFMIISIGRSYLVRRWFYGRRRRSEDIK